MNQAPALAYFSLSHRPGGDAVKRMAYWHFGDHSAKHLIVCVHGLTRQGRDFDVLAQAIVDKACTRGESVRVISVDVIGRGMSDWLADPMGYTIPNYAQDMTAFLTMLHQNNSYDKFDWVGTSMGGLIGIAVLGSLGLGDSALAVNPRHLVLNDVGPVIEWPSLVRIGTYLGQHVPGVGIFDTEQQGADALWRLASAFGPHSPAEWRALSRPQLKKCANGQYTHAYDPAIATLFKTASRETVVAGEAMLWKLYENISAKTLITRGLESDLLSISTAHAMTQRGLKMPVPARVVEFAGVGHAPTFVAKDQHDVVAQFLLD